MINSGYKKVGESFESKIDAIISEVKFEHTSASVK